MRTDHPVYRQDLAAVRAAAPSLEPLRGRTVLITGATGLVGAFLTDAIGKYDVDLVQAIVMLYASLGILGLFLGDLLMTVLDPRIRLTGKGGAR